MPHFLSGIILGSLITAGLVYAETFGGYDYGDPPRSGYDYGRQESLELQREHNRLLDQQNYQNLVNPC